MVICYVWLARGKFSTRITQVWPIWWLMFILLIKDLSNFSLYDLLEFKFLKKAERVSSSSWYFCLCLPMSNVLAELNLLKKTLSSMFYPFPTIQDFFYKLYLKTEPQFPTYPSYIDHCMPPHRHASADPIGPGSPTYQLCLTISFTSYPAVSPL